VYPKDSGLSHNEMTTTTTTTTTTTNIKP